MKPPMFRWGAAAKARRRRVLYNAVAGLPAEVRGAMLASIATEQLIAGAYTDRRGRMCPALAAHRRGARSNVGEFAKAWDRFTGARRPRPASRRELEVLTAMLQETLAGSRQGGPLDAPFPGCGDAEPADVMHVEGLRA